MSPPTRRRLLPSCQLQPTCPTTRVQKLANELKSLPRWHNKMPIWKAKAQHINQMPRSILSQHGEVDRQHLPQSMSSTVTTHHQSCIKILSIQKGQAKKVQKSLPLQSLMKH